MAKKSAKKATRRAQATPAARPKPTAALIDAALERKPTINDVARIAGVSKKTDSRVINRSPLLSDAETISVTVDEVNQPPSLTPIGDKAVNEGAAVTFTASASDPDLPGQSLTFSLDSGAPATAAINPASGEFTWTTAEADGPGSYPVTVRVTDNGSPEQTAAEALIIVVIEVNLPPVLSAIGDQVVNAGGTLTFMAGATDDDLPAQTLTFSLEPGAPNGAEVAANGLFTWTPVMGHMPLTNQITLRVQDNGSPGQSDFKTFDVIIVEPPLITITREPDGRPRLTWTAFPGKTYQVLASSDPASDIWIDLGAPIEAAAATESWVDDSPAAAQKFYQIQQLD